MLASNYVNYDNYSSVNNNQYKILPVNNRDIKYASNIPKPNNYAFENSPALIKD